MKPTFKLSILAALVLAPAAFSASANTTNAQIQGLTEQLNKFRVSGYINVTGGIATEENKVFFQQYENDKFQTTAETWGGIQLDFKATDKLNFTLLTKFFAEEKAFDERFGVDLAYLTYQVAEQTKLRAGILRVPIYKDSDYKDTGYSLLWLRAPELIYDNSKIQRHTGVDILQDIYLGNGTLQLQAFYGQNEDPRATGSAERGNYTGPTLVIDDLTGLHGSYSINDHFFKLGVTTRSHVGEADNFIYTDTRDRLRITNEGPIAGDRQTFYSAGYGYDNGEWKIDIESILTIQDGAQPDNIKSYASIGYRFNAVTPYLLFQTLNTIDDEKRGYNKNIYTHTDGTTQAVFTTTSLGSQILSVGVRYDIVSNLALKGQIDRYEQEVVRAVENPSVVEADNTLYSISLQAIF